MVFPAKPGSQKRPHEESELQMGTSVNGNENSGTEPCPKRKRQFDFDAHPKRKIALQFLYEGWDFEGLVQQTTTENTVERHLMDALLKTKLISNEKDCDFSRCGRTDRGVSAFKQVAALLVRSADKSGKFVFWPESTDQSVIDNYPKKEELSYLKMLNGVLPKNISVIAWAPVPQEFSARHACNMRIYKYSMPRANLDLEVDMNEKRVNTSFVREIFDVSLEVLPTRSSTNLPSRNDLIELTIKGSGFLWHMIRYIVTVLHEIGQKNEEPELVSALLNIEKTPCRPQYTLATGTPLCLYECRFDSSNLEWIYDDFALKRTMASLQSDWADLQTKARTIENMLQDLADTPIGSGVDLDKGLLEFTQDRPISTRYIKFADRKTCDSVEQKRAKLERKKISNNGSG
ncbi:tRNA pseudouridine synthase A [Necator americanus]|uniref:tRNA pseudouridine synthase n=1 Tax=Necator americanus TaxID=51031 RepID=W2SJF4_NECAM|nr:tRNA pseudouridine synthase A [Necator americanus]ETN69735.1 tRNA pseudouridine synthase A [Necator americanus]